MKLFNAIAAAGVVVSGLITTGFAQAQQAPNGWFLVGINRNDIPHYVKKIDQSGRYRRHHYKTGDTSFLVIADCQGWRRNEEQTKIERDGSIVNTGNFSGWTDVMPGNWEQVNLHDESLKYVCR